jgi:hypothetical protein
VAAQSRCDRCAPLGAGEIANTGRDERLSPAWGRMQRLGLDSRVDLGICPQCGALFEWSDHPQFFGSGNLDEEHLRRLDEPESGLVRALLRAGEDPEAAQAAIAPALTGGVPDDLLIQLLRRLVYRQRSGFRRLLPSVLAHLHHTRYTGYGDVLGCYIVLQPSTLARDRRPDRGRPAAAPPPAVTYLLERCRKQLAAAE